MKGLSLFFLKNSVGANMKKGLRSSCNGDASTSTLPCTIDDHNSTATTATNPPRKSVTLEEMILQLELEEELARRAAPDAHHEKAVQRRMSCVNNSEILRSARNALNQYPRFSLDGKDAMYRSSFRKVISREAEDQMRVHCGQRRRRSSVVAGESVVWCNPGVVARLMGLEAIPVPAVRMARKKNSNPNPNRNPNRSPRRRNWCASSSASKYCVMRPVEVAGEGRHSFSCQPTSYAFL